ncbi:50S ribosomal protein L13 [Candidatus Parcubacteria bacterium]|nr:50S ribosomal protein L13 [Candidatus Parcubacteria bacterium]
MQKVTLDATNKRPGRLATEVAVLLMGKNRTDYVRNDIPDISVEVTNASKLSISEKKRTGKTYSRHSGYPGSLKTLSVEQVVEKKGAKEVLRKAVMGMLPKNKLRARMIKNLTIKD